MDVIKFGQTKVPEVDHALYYFARRVFHLQERPFTREECNDLMRCKMKPKKAVNAVQHDIYDIFDDDTHDMTKSLKKRAQENEVQLLREVKEILQSLLANNEDFKDRMKKLRGFQGKMSDRLILEGKDIQTINDKALRVDELYLLYHLLRYVEDDDGTTIPEIQARYCWDRERGGKEIRPTCRVFKTLAESGNTVTRAIASAVTLKEHNFFSNIAVDKFRKYGKNVRLNQRYHDDFKRFPQDPLTTNPTAMAALTVTAGPSSERDPDWSDMNDFPTPPPPDKRARESTDSSSPASEAGPSKETKKSKDKAKGKDTVKGKGKEPEGKRPRPSGHGQKK